MTLVGSYSITVNDITAEQVWNVWSDIDKRHLWDDDTEWAKLNGPFKTGTTFAFKPINGPKLHMTITECTPNKSFTDCFKLPLARIYGVHEMENTPEGLRLTAAIHIEGPLQWIWRKIIAEKIAATLQHQTEQLLKMVRGKNEICL